MDARETRTDGSVIYKLVHSGFDQIRKTTIIKLPTMINGSLQLSRIEGKCLVFSKLAIIQARARFP